MSELDLMKRQRRIRAIATFCVMAGFAGCVLSSLVQLARL